MQKTQVKRIPVRSLRSEEGADEMNRLPEMRPYFEALKATIPGRDPAPELQAVAALPLEKRYVWRIALALRQAFCDFDSETVRMDLATLSAEQIAEVQKLVAFRPMQLAWFFQTLFGIQSMQSHFTQAIRNAQERGARENSGKHP
jgi:hypothetical protein